jgi:hypothetical protein
MMEKSFCGASLRQPIPVKLLIATMQIFNIIMTIRMHQSEKSYHLVAGVVAAVVYNNIEIKVSHTG